MTYYSTAVYREQPLPRGRSPWLLILILAAVIYAAHATVKHAGDADNIRDCLNERGPDQVFRSMSPYQQNKWYLGCQLEDGRWGLQILIRKSDGTWQEKTSFIPKRGSWRDWLEYVSARARLWNGPPG